MSNKYPKEYYSAYDGVHVVGDGDCLVATIDGFDGGPEGHGQTDAEAIAELAVRLHEEAKLDVRAARLEGAEAMDERWMGDTTGSTVPRPEKVVAALEAAEKEAGQ